ncbi:uncharacterized protein [Clytia hemisphaerica]|uniref:uncharacterized protein n=1 Tax=Clytia hemisphaerica TaxID=252671 RepID=UPI0034D3DDAC
MSDIFTVGLESVGLLTTSLWHRVSCIKKSGYCKREQNKESNQKKPIEVLVISDSEDEGETEILKKNRFFALSNEDVLDGYSTDESFNMKPFASKPMDNQAPIVIHDSSDEEFTDNLHSPAVCDDILDNDIILEEDGRGQVKIPRVVWEDQEEQEVDNIPYNIDGLCIYKVKADKRSEIHEKLHDGRRWKRDSRTTWAGFESVRYRDCSGGYTCPNTDCPFFIEFKHPNKNRFKKKSLCEYCEVSGFHTSCNARKYTCFRSDTEVLVYHVGLHTCEAKKKDHRPVSIVRDAVKRNANGKSKQ